MGMLLLWIEGLAAVVLLYAAFIAWLERFERRQLSRVLLAIVGLALALPGIAMMALAHFLEALDVWRHQFWSFMAILWTVSYLALGTALAVIGGRRRGEPPQAVARDWPVGWLLLGSLTCVGLMLATLTSMDTASQIQLASLRAEAASLAHIAAPARPADASNAAPLYQEAFETLNLKQLSTRQQEWLSDPAQTDLTDADVAEFLDKNRRCLVLLHRAAARPSCFFVHGHYARLDMAVPELQLMRNGARLLALDAHAQARHGDLAAALRDVATMRQLSRHACNEPYLISFLVASAIDNIALRTLDGIFSRYAPDAKALEALVIEDPTLYRMLLQRSLQMEQAMVLTAFADLSAGDDQTMFLSEPAWQPPAVALSFWRIFLLAEDLASYRGMMGQMIGRLGEPYPDPAERHDPPPHGLITRLVTPALGKVHVAASRADAGERLMQAALAVARYRAAEGKVPERLDQLVPKFLPYVPVDPFSGEPLRLKARGKGCLLYSVGPNRRDDGGSTDPKQPNEGDLVIRIGTDVQP